MCRTYIETGFKSIKLMTPTKRAVNSQAFMSELKNLTDKCDYVYICTKYKLYS